jgi:Skp family chaperone for outer membrane proteins
MSAETFAERIVRLEARMSDLQELPARVHDLTLQVSQLRSDLSAEFSAVRGEMRALHEDVLARLDAHQEVLTRLDADKDETRREMRALHEDVVGRLDAHQEVLTRLDADKNDTRREIRVLHEEILSRIALLGEGRAKPSRKKARRSKR